MSAVSDSHEPDQQGMLRPGKTGMALQLSGTTFIFSIPVITTKKDLLKGPFFMHKMVSFRPYS